MQRIFSITLVLYSLVSFSSWGETMDDLVKREGLYYKKFSNLPFTGRVECDYQGYFNNGNKDGSWLIYYLNGQLHSKGNYENGKKEGLWVYNHYNGQEKNELTGTYRNGKKISN